MYFDMDIAFESCLLFIYVGSVLIMLVCLKPDGNLDEIKCLSISQLSFESIVNKLCLWL